MNASEEDAVIFSGHGCTGAVQKLITALDFREPPIVFTSPSEHQDNVQLWQEIGAKVGTCCCYNALEISVSVMHRIDLELSQDKSCN